MSYSEDRILEKLDKLDEDVNSIKIDMEIVKTKMELREHEAIPARVRGLEEFKSKVMVFTSIFVVGATTALNTLLDWLKEFKLFQ